MEFAKRVTLIGRGSQNEVKENWLLFERDVAHLISDHHQIAENSRLTVQIAFRVSDYEPNGRPNVTKLRPSYLNVLFATASETHLGFLMQGPFRTTPARDNISSKNEGDKKFNLALAEESGEMVLESLRWLRDRQWLSVDVLNTMPLAYLKHEFGYEKEVNPFRWTLFAPIYEKVMHGLMNEALIPAFGGGYVSAKDARIAGSVAIRSLLDSSQLQQLFEFNEHTQWLTSEIKEDKTENLWRYLTTILGVEVIDAQKFAQVVDREFLHKQSDEWIRRFYEYASAFNSRSYPQSSPFNILRQKPIIRLENGDHIAPYRNYWDDKPQVYLPAELESHYDTVKCEVCNSDKSLEFLKKVGLNEPDDVDEVLDHILPKYKGGQEIGDNEHQNDIMRIVQALGVDSLTRKSEILKELKQTSFIFSENSVGDSAFRKPGEVYFRDSTRKMYFEGNPDGWFISSEYEPYVNDLKQLGILTDLVTIQEPNHLGYVKFQTPEKGSESFPHKRGKNRFDPGFKVDGLAFALRHPSNDRSRFIWNRLLIPYKHSIIGEVESSPVQSFPSHRTTTERSVLSKVGNLVRESAWLPAGNGNFVKPSKLSIDDWPEGFRRDDELAGVLGINARQFRIDDAPDDIKAIVLATKGRSPEELEEALALLDEKKEKERDNVGAFEPDEHSSLLLDDFNRTGSPRIPRPARNDYPDDAPEDKRINTEIEIGSEPDPEERYEVRINRIWKPKNPETRKFLINEYPSGCQFQKCNHSFLKRDNSPYFEAVHFIPRTSAQWLDHPRNAVCLCGHHAAQWKHGKRRTPDSDIVEQIRSSEEGHEYSISLELCGETHDVKFTANHIDEVRIALEVTEYM